jgi:hypothetical protein
LDFVCQEISRQNIIRISTHNPRHLSNSCCIPNCSVSKVNLFNKIFAITHARRRGVRESWVIEAERALREAAGGSSA